MCLTSYRLLKFLVEILSVSLSLTHARTPTHTHTQMHTCMHTHLICLTRTYTRSKAAHFFVRSLPAQKLLRHELLIFRWVKKIFVLDNFFTLDLLVFELLKLISTNRLTNKFQIGCWQRYNAFFLSKDILMQLMNSSQQLISFNI